MTIARTELAAAYNIGEYQADRQAMEADYMGGVVKVWLDADDDRVCKRCRALGKASREHPVPMEAAFEEPGRQPSKPGCFSGTRRTVRCTAARKPAAAARTAVRTERPSKR